jgi:hypothetical protein
MEYLDTEETKLIFTDLKRSINQFHAKYSDLEKNGMIDMSDIMRNCTKMEHYINSEFYELWQLEQEERRKLAKRLENAVLMCCEAPCRSTVEDEEDSDSCDSMPPLINIDSLKCPAESSDLGPLEASDISEYKVNERDYTKPLYPLYYTPHSRSIWNWGSSSSVLGALSFNKDVLNL